MKKIKLLLLACIVLFSLSACSKDNALTQSPNNTQQQTPKTNTPATEPVVVGTSTSCDKPPKQLELSSKTYQLKSENAKGEPVMKLAYIKCDKGKFTLGDAEDSYTVHYASDPSKNNGDILLLGNWGGTGSWSQALYSLDEKTTSPATTQQPTKDTESIVYENSKNNFILKIPKSWDGKYDVVENGDGLRFVYKANKNGILFSLTIWSKEKWSTDGAELAKNIHISKIGEKGDKIYTLSTPTDVQVDPSDKKMTADYASMWEDIEGIKATFELKK